MSTDTDKLFDLLVPTSRMAFIYELIEQYRLDVEGGQSISSEETYKDATTKALLLTATYSRTFYPHSNECVPVFSAFAQYLTGTVLYDAITSYCSWVDGVSACTLAVTLAADKEIQVEVISRLPDIDFSIKSLIFCVQLMMTRNRRSGKKSAFLAPYIETARCDFPDEYITPRVVGLFSQGINMLAEQEEY